MKPTQFTFVKNTLEMYGEVTRNECLREFISRLGAIIHVLKKEGWVFTTETRDTVKHDGSKGKDFVYKLVSKPLL